MKLQKSYLVVSCLLLVTAVPLFAQTAYQRTTIQASAAPYCTPWVDSGAKAGVAWSASTTTGYVEIFPDTQYQQIFGFGGTFQELAWAAMNHLSAAGKDSVMRALFDTSGCSLNWGRIPIGCCDYDFGVAPYSLDDNSGDYSMAHFSMARDSAKRIPFIKAAQALQPNLRFFASPWSPPGWMKSSNSYSGGNIKTDSATMAAYALYLDKWLQGYNAAGINVESITCQNEPDQTAGNYPQCGWTEAQEQTFYHNYMIPQFKKDNLSARILIGVYCCLSVSGWVTPFLQDAVVGPFVNYTSHSYENTTWGPQCVALKPYVPFIETESAWNPGDETWSTGSGIFSNMQQFMSESTSVYTIWNCVDNSTGRGGFAGSALGAQPIMITIDTTSRKVTYSPYFYACKHYGHYIKPGAYFVKSVAHGVSNITGSAYRNPDSSVIWVVSTTSANPVTIKIGSEAYKVVLPANSFNTLRIVKGSISAVDPEMQQNNYAASPLNNVRIRNSTLYFSLSAAVKERQVDLTLTDLQGRTVWTGHRAGSALQGGQHAFAIRSVHGNLRSGTYLLAVRIKSEVGAVTTVEKKVAAVN